MVGGGKACGEADIKKVLSLGKVRLEGGEKIAHIRSGSAGHAALAHFFIEVMEGPVIVGEAFRLVIKFYRQAAKRHAPLCKQRRLNIAGGICKNYIVFHGIPLSALAFANNFNIGYSTT